MDVVPQLAAEGATLVAVTPESPDHAAATAKKHKLPFQVLSDKGSKIAKAYRVAYTVPGPTVAGLKEFKVDLTERNGDDSPTLPLAATYVIDADGVVRWAFVDADYRKRAEPADVLAAVKKLRAK